MTGVSKIGRRIVAQAGEKSKVFRARTGEAFEAEKYAHLLLDEADQGLRDPDSDMVTLARQFLRSVGHGGK